MHFIQRKISTDPDWKHLTVVFSGPNVPGEGEHKIMQFIREQRLSKATGPLAYHANLRHCIMGQDGDLMMLGLATHEPNLVLLREQVVFDSKRKPDTIQDYVFNGCFELLHMNVLRDYFSYEFETAISDDWDLEHCIDDFVFMTFFVGNDFLPHMPGKGVQVAIVNCQTSNALRSYGYCRRGF
jgi:5'-3' exoribonuclease 1